MVADEVDGIDGFVADGLPRRLRLVFGEVRQTISLNELNHDAVDFKKGIFGKKGVHVNTREELRNILSLDILQMAVSFYLALV